MFKLITLSFTTLVALTLFQCVCVYSRVEMTECDFVIGGWGEVSV